MSISQVITRFVAVGATIGIIAACNQGPTERTGAASLQQNAASNARATCSPNQGEDACAMCCAGNGPAKPIFEAAGACFQGCGNSDKGCFDQCFKTLEEECYSAGPECIAAMECMEKSCESCDNKKPKEPNKSLVSAVRGGNEKPKPECEGEGDDDDDDNGGGDDDDDDDKK
jgi:hypothetical protein